MTAEEADAAPGMDALVQAQLELAEVRGWLANLRTQLAIAQAEADYWRQRTIWFAKASEQGEKTTFTFPDGEVIDLKET